MSGINELINDYRNKLEKIVNDMNALVQYGTQVNQKIAQLEDLRDDDNNSPTGIEEPVMMENEVSGLKNRLEQVEEGFVRLENNKTKLIEELQTILRNATVVQNNTRTARSSRRSSTARGLKKYKKSKKTKRHRK